MSWLTQNDVQNYGSDLLDVTQRAALHAVGPHIDLLAQQNAELQRQLAQEARHALDMRVEKAVPNFREIDRDPRWLNWLDQPDPLSGRRRQQLLNEAIDQSNTGRVVSFFRQFENQAASQASYYGSRGSASGQIYTPARIKQLYEQHRRGAYAGREAAWQQQEADIFRAQKEGRVLASDYITK